MSKIDTFITAISTQAVNIYDIEFKTWIGDIDFIPEPVITDSGDFNCGALCDELEFLQSVSDYFVESFSLEDAEDTNLNKLITSIIDLSRIQDSETDEGYRNRFRAIVTENNYPSRTNKWAIREAVNIFIDDINRIQIIELFDIYNLYFQIRIEGSAISDNDALVLNSLEQGFLDQFYLSGLGIGAAITFLGDIIDRIKAAGVDYDIIFIGQHSITKTAQVVIGSVQKTIISNATILKSMSLTKVANATIV